MNQLRGNLGGTRYSVRKGKQVVTARAESVERANTYAQVEQKIKLAPLVQFYKAATDNFFKFAFAHKTRAQTDYNAFVSKNMNVSPFLTKQEAAAWPAYPAPYIVADGNLPINFHFQDFFENPPRVMRFSEISDLAFPLRTESGGAAFGGCFIPLDETDTGEQQVSLGTISYLLKSSLPVNDGDRITFLSVTPYTSSQEINGVLTRVPACAWCFDSFVIDENDNRLLPLVQNLGASESALCVASLPDQNSNYLAVGVKSSAIGADGVPIDGGGCVAVIVTRKTPTGIACNRAVLRMRLDEFISAPASGVLYEEKRTEEARLAAALSYGYNPAPLHPIDAPE